MNRTRNIQIFVRNKQKYNPATFSKNLQHVDIADFAGTTVGYIKEECRRNNAARIDDLYLYNEPLADDRSVAHYNLADGTILETTSNPLWVACMNIKMVEVERERDAHPNNPGVQKWTEKSYIRKRTILSVLLNSKSEFPRQPPYLPTVESLVDYLKTLGKKGAEMNPNYTQRDLQQMYDEYQMIDIHQPDPIGSFLTRHATRLGFDGMGVTPTVAKRKPPAKKTYAKTTKSTPAWTKKSTGTRKSGKQDVVCEDCESNPAELYCPDCQGVEDRPGVCLCMTCADKLHTGALKRNHSVRDISAAPRVPKQYTPHPYRAPFAIMIGMYSGLLDTPPVLSMNEVEIKVRAQPFTDTDLQDKQTGRYVGGFDCVENTLVKKGFIQKEAADRHTFALTESGQRLGEQLYMFHEAVTCFLAAHRVPDIPVQQIHTQCGTRRLYLVIDEKERDLNRLCNIAKDHGIPTLIRGLQTGDYTWILSPPLTSPHADYNGNNRAAEVLLPFLVERKSWDDFYNSWRGTRFRRQIENMKASGVRNCFYMVEGSVRNLRFVSPDQQQRLKDQLESLLCQDGFYVNYTSSWSKSARWLCWMTSLIADANRQGAFKDFTMTFPHIQRNIMAKNRNTGNMKVKTKGRTHTWLWQDFIHAIRSDSSGEQSFRKTCEENFGSVSSSHDPTQLLLIEGLEIYNKQRSSLLNQSLESVVNLTQNQLQDAVSTHLKSDTDNLIHYDVFSYWQLYIQVNYGVYVIRTETNEDTIRIQTQFAHGTEQNAQAQNLPPQQQVIMANVQPLPLRMPEDGPRGNSQDIADVADSIGRDDYAPDSQTEKDMMKKAMAESRMELEVLQSRSHSPDHRLPSTSQTPIQHKPSTSTSKSATAGAPLNSAELRFGTSRLETVSNRSAQIESVYAGQSRRSLVKSTATSVADCHSESLICVVDSQEDAIATSGKSFLDVSVDVCGSSLDDPVVLEDSQSQEVSPVDKSSVNACGDIPCITLTDSQEDSPELDFGSNQNKFVTETQVKPPSVLVNGSDKDDIKLDIMSEEEQLKLAMSRSLCESSLGVQGACVSTDMMQLVHDHNANTLLLNSSKSNLEHKPVPGKTPTKRRHQTENESSSIKIPKLDIQSGIVLSQQVILGKESYSDNFVQSIDNKQTLSDEELARKLQEEFDEEYKESKSQTLQKEAATRNLRSKRGKNLESSTSSDAGFDDVVLQKKLRSCDPCVSVSDCEKPTRKNLKTDLSIKYSESFNDLRDYPISNSDSSQTKSDVAKHGCRNVDFGAEEDNLACGDTNNSDSSKIASDCKPHSKTELVSGIKCEVSSHTNCAERDTDSKTRQQSSLSLSQMEGVTTVDADVKDCSQLSESVASQSILNLDPYVKDVEPSDRDDVYKEPGVPAEPSSEDMSCQDDTCPDYADDLRDCVEDRSAQTCSKDMEKSVGGTCHSNGAKQFDGVYSSSSYELESQSHPTKSRMKSFPQSSEEEDVHSVIKTESVTDEEYARQLQEQFNKESRTETISQYREPKSLRSRGTGASSDVTRRQCVSECSPGHQLHDRLIATQDDEEFAKQFQLEENIVMRGSVSSGPMADTYHDEEFARQLQLDEDAKVKQSKILSKCQTEAPNIDHDAELARQLSAASDVSLDAGNRTESYGIDAELAKSLQEEERRKFSAGHGPDLVAKDEVIARRVLLEEQMSLGKGTSFTINEDAEFAKKVQMEENMLSKPTLSSDFGNSSANAFSKNVPVLDVETFDYKNSHYVTSQNSPSFEHQPRRPIKRDGSERIMADQLASYRESQKQKFCNKTSTGTFGHGIHSTTSHLSSSVSSPSHKPVIATPQRVPSATVSSPWQQATGSRTPPRPPVIPVGRVIPTSNVTSSTFKGLGHKPVDNDKMGLKVENVKKEVKDDDDIIDITDNHNKEEGDSPSKSMVVKNIRCGNCKQLGHPRTYSQCPYFYKQSEVEHREAKAKENLKRREEKAKENEETLALLSNSERILKERKQAMLAQLKAEAEKVEEEFTDQIRQLSQVVKRHEKRTNKKNK